MRIWKISLSSFQMGSIELGEKLCSFARMGSKTKLICYQLAGANLATSNLSGQNCLHAAVETGQVKVAQYLFGEKVDPFKKDLYGMTALDIAQKLERHELVHLLSKYIEEYQFEFSVRPGLGY